VRPVARRRDADFVAELRQQLGDRAAARAVGTIAVEALEELRGAERRPDLPAHARRAAVIRCDVPAGIADVDIAPARI